MAGSDESVLRFVRLATPAMALVDLEGQIVEVSGAFSRALGSTALVGSSLAACGPAAWVDACARASHGELVEGESLAGGARYLRWTMQAWSPRDLVLVIEDVTPARQALLDGERRENRLYAQIRGLSALSRCSAAIDADLSALSAEACEIIAATLDVARVDVWTLDEPGLLRCVDRYDHGRQSHTIRAPIRRDDVPVLIMIEQQGHLARTGVAADPILQTSPALFDEGAFAALLVGVSPGSKLEGLIVCQSNTEGRDWSLEDRAFVTSAASTLALAVETTRRRAAEGAALERMREVDEARARAEAADRAKSDFLATMSHEIRTPMNGVIGFTELLLDSRLDDEQRSFTHTIKASAGSLLTVINDILDFSKIEAGKFNLESTPFDLEGVLGDALELCSARAEEKGVSLALEYPRGLPRFFQGDGGRVRQVVLNLVGNALKFTTDGVVFVRVSEQGPGVKVEVVDTGIGISPDVLPRLFARFAQADLATTRKYGGTGLGLAISRKLVELMGGAIGVESVLGTGSTFWFTLGHRLEVNVEVPVEPSAPVRVLLVERHEAVRRMWTAALAPLNAQVSCVATLAEATALATFALVVTSDAKVVSMVEGPSPRVLLRVSSQRARQPEGGAALIARSTVRPEALARAARQALQVERVVEPRPVAVLPLRVMFDGLSVLLVEDNRVNQRLAERLLSRRGCLVTLAEDGLQGVKCWTKGRFDVVLMDCNMPELDGFEATARIRELEKELGLSRTPIVALTADAMEGDRQRCLAAGMDDYLSKPLLDEKLVAVLVSLSPRGQRVTERANQAVG
ncbi:MAG: ATP-binding protein [Archangium sp.]|nr:ATP-binding protein [Archangium sp.]